MNCLLGAIDIVNNDNDLYSDQGMAFDGKSKCSFGNEFARNL